MNLSDIVLKDKEYLEVCRETQDMFNEFNNGYAGMTLCDHYAYIKLQKDPKATNKEICQYVRCRIDYDLKMIKPNIKFDIYKITNTNY